MRDCIQDKPLPLVEVFPPSGTYIADYPCLTVPGGDAAAADASRTFCDWLLHNVDAGSTGTFRTDDTPEAGATFLQGPNGVSPGAEVTVLAPPTGDQLLQARDDWNTVKKQQDVLFLVDACQSMSTDDLYVLANQVANDIAHRIDPDARIGMRSFNEREAVQERRFRPLAQSDTLPVALPTQNSKCVLDDAVWRALHDLSEPDSESISTIVVLSAGVDSRGVVAARHLDRRLKQLPGEASAPHVIVVSLGGTPGDAALQEWTTRAPIPFYYATPEAGSSDPQTREQIAEDIGSRYEPATADRRALRDRPGDREHAPLDGLPRSPPRPRPGGRAEGAVHLRRRGLPAALPQRGSACGAPGAPSERRHGLRLLRGRGECLDRDGLLPARHAGAVRGGLVRHSGHRGCRQRARRPPGGADSRHRPPRSQAAEPDGDRRRRHRRRGLRDREGARRGAAAADDRGQVHGDAGVRGAGARARQGCDAGRRPLLARGRVPRASDRDMAVSRHHLPGRAEGAENAAGRAVAPRRARSPRWRRRRHRTTRQARSHEAVRQRDRSAGSAARSGRGGVGSGMAGRRHAPARPPPPSPPPPAPPLLHEQPVSEPPTR